MPSVPRYDTPQAEAQPLRAPDQRSVASPELFGAVPTAETGKALMSAGAGLGVVAYHMQQKENADSVFRAETALKDSYLGYEQDVRKTRQGRFAKDLTADTTKWWDENVKKHSDNLENDDQRRIFQQRAASVRQQSLSSVSHWEAVQLDKSHDEGWLADKNATVSLAAATSSPENVARARLELDRLNRYQGVRKGWEAAQLQGENLKDTTNLHKQVIQGLAQSNPVVAKEYFETYKSEIDGSLHAEIGAFTKRVTAQALGENAAAEVWTTHGPKTDRDAANLDTMEEEVRKKFKGDEPAMKAGIAALRDRTSAFDKGRKERDEATEADIWRAVNGGAGVAQVRSMPQFLVLNPTKAAQITEHLENRAYTKTQHDEAQKTQQMFGAYLVYSNPDTLDGMSENQILNLTPVLGNTLGGHLMEKKRALTGAKVIEAKLDQDDFNHIAQQAGLSPFDPTKNEKQKAQLGELKYNIEHIIDGEQARLKRPLQREEKMIIMRREIDNKVLNSTWFGLSSEAKPVMLLPAADLKDAWVMVNGKKIQLGSIPAADRAEIIKARQKRGLPVSEQAIAETWVAGNKRKGAPGATGAY